MSQFHADNLQATIEQSLQSIAQQLGESISETTAQQLYQEAVQLLSHLDYAPVTLARLAGTLLVYRLKPTDPAELDWLKTQIQGATEAEEVEELLASMSRESL